MCLQVYAVPVLGNRVSAERLARVSGLWVKKVNRPIKGAFWFSVDGGCSCSLLADEADWNAPVWALEPKVLEGLAAALELLGDEAGGFTFQALWVGDQAETEGQIPLAEMLQDVRNDRVRNKHTYRVTTVPAHSPDGP